MDPIQQIGWSTRRRHVGAVGANLVRDAFVAADEVHSNAMSAMDGNAGVEGSTAGASGAGEDGASSHAGSSVRPLDSMDAAMEGEQTMPGLYF
jgi:hypothetical protein